MKLIVGLGNPWKEYEKTRHNIWFIMLDRFVDENKLGIFSFDKKYSWEILITEMDGEKIVFCKPQTFMNRSGDAVAPLANFYKIESKNILVLHDEIDFITGRIAFKFGWSPAGHNWLKSLIARLGTPDFARIRIWVDRPLDNKFVADWVLSTFKPEEKKLLEEKYDEVEKLIWEFLKV